MAYCQILLTLIVQPIDEALETGVASVCSTADDHGAMDTLLLSCTGRRTADEACSRGPLGRYLMPNLSNLSIAMSSCMHIDRIGLGAAFYCFIAAP